MKLQRRQCLMWGLGLGALSATPAWARLQIDINGVGGDTVPIVVKPLLTNAKMPLDVAEVIRQDLARTGNFRLIESVSPEPAATLANPADLKDWAQAGASYVVTGAANQIGPQLWEIKLFLLDAVSGELLESYAIQSTDRELRPAAHQLADRLYAKITGYGPFMYSPLVYVAKLSPTRYQLVLSDSDGDNPVPLLNSREPIISPTFMPDGQSVMYVTFEHKKPEIMLQRLATGQRSVIANYEGNNSAPAISPDGKTVAMALSRGGRTQIWIKPVAGGQLKRFTQSYGIDTEPTFAPDGQSLYFTSDRGGTPQIYRQRLDGEQAQRITYNDGYAISPAISPDGKLLAYIARQGTAFRLGIMDLATGQTRYITTTTQDESPSFAPNGRYVIYATRKDGKGVLSMASIDGRVNVVLSQQGQDIREPCWGPLYR